MTVDLSAEQVATIREMVERDISSLEWIASAETEVGSHSERVGAASLAMKTQIARLTALLADLGGQRL